MYPQWQSTVTSGSLFGALQGVGSVVWERLRWYWLLFTKVCHYRMLSPGERLALWIAWLETYDAERYAVLERVMTAFERPEWEAARQAVRDCATTPKFHQPEQWIEYGRVLKANRGQTLNVFRHLRAVHMLRPITDDPAPISNPDAHLMVELAYHGFRFQGREGRRIVKHKKRIIPHLVLHRKEA